MQAHQQANAQDTVLHNAAKLIQTIKALIEMCSYQIHQKTPNFKIIKTALDNLFSKISQPFFYLIKFTYLHSYETLTLIFHFWCSTYQFLINTTLCTVKYSVKISPRSHSLASAHISFSQDTFNKVSYCIFIPTHTKSWAPFALTKQMSCDFIYQQQPKTDHICLANNKWTFIVILWKQMKNLFLPTHKSKHTYTPLFL